jgi:hypothetical protein
MIKSRLCVVVALSTCACLTVDTPPECRLSSDCPDLEECFEQRCVAECREDRDCMDKETCSEKKCIPTIPPARVCQFARQCMENETCRSGLCEQVSLQIDTPPNPSSDGGIPPGRDAGSSGGLPYGAVCTSAAQCESMHCLGPNGQGRCTIACTDNAQCVYPDACLDIPNVGKFCGVLPNAGATGAPCMAPSDCETGICISPDNICTRECSGFSSCPSGMTCQPVAAGNGTAVTLCVLGTGAGFGSPCARAAECFSALCVGVPSTSSGICTAQCDQVPCPLGWSCTSVPDGAGGTARVCALEGQSAGGYGSMCTQASECTNGLCLNDSRSMSAFCTISCMRNSDCAGVAGLVCVTIQGGGQVCGPP